MPQYRLRTIMICIAFVALLATIVFQSIRLQSLGMHVRELQAKLERAETEAAWAQAIEEYHRFWASRANQQKWATQMDYERHRKSVANAPR